MKHFAVTSFILLRASVLYAIDIPTATYDVRPAEGNLFALDVFKSKLWEGRKHTFVFDRFRGSLSFNQEQPERSTAQFVVESASARCTDDWVKPHPMARRNARSAPLQSQSARIRTWPSAKCASAALSWLTDDSRSNQACCTYRQGGAARRRNLG